VNLRELRLRRMPGIEDPFVLRATAGLNLLVGPNGSGKSTICRALRALLWPEAERPDPCSLSALWLGDGERFFCEREGRSPTLWQRDGRTGPPPELPQGHLARCYELGLLDLHRRQAGPTDRTLAGEILTQMAGGYDLQVLLSSFPESRQPARQESRQLKEQRSRLSGLRQHQTELAQEEERLAGLMASREEARRARARLAFWEAAERLLRAREELAGRERLCASYPAGLARLHGDELAVLQTMDQELSELAREEDDGRRSLAAAEAQIVASGLSAGSLPPEPELRAWKKRSERLAEQERELARWREEAAERQARLRQIHSSLAGELGLRLRPDQQPTATAGDAAPPPPETDWLGPAERNLERLSRLSWQHRALGELLAQFEADAVDGGQPTTDADSPERAPEPPAARLSEGARALADWFAVAPFRSRPPILLPAAVSLAVLVTGGALLLGGHAGGWIVLGAAGLLLAAIWLTFWRSRPQSGRAALRQAARSRYLDLGLPEPADWQEGPVLDRLAELHRQIGAACIGEGRRRLLGLLSARRHALESELEAARSEHQALARRCGLDPDAAPRELLLLAQKVLDLQRGGQELAGLQERIATRQESGRQELQRLNRFLTGHAADPARDATGGGEALAHLEQRCHQFTESTRRVADGQDQLVRLQERRARREEQRAALFDRAGLADGQREELRELLASHEPYAEDMRVRDQLRRLVQEYEGQLAGCRRRLPVATEAFLPASEELPPLPALTERIDRDRSRADKLEGLVQRITTIENAIESARRDDAVQRALAAQRQAEAALEARREEAMLRAAGRFLVERAQQEHEQEGRPEPLARAAELFARFTQDAYELLVQRREGEAVFFARDRSSGRGLDLDQLSDGTRAQLLLAARLGFLFAAERGVRPPLLFDEALSASDPVRFHAVACSLLRVAEEEDRQVFYLTADPADAEAWQRALAEVGQEAVAPLDLMELRGIAGGAPAGQLELRPLPRVGAPQPDESPAEYGRRLHVPPLRPARPSTAAHLFHLLPDDPVLLHRLLESGLQTVGQWQGAARRLAVQAELPAGAVERISARAGLLAAFIAAWRRGRGLPVDREVLEQSGAVSRERFLPEVATLAERLAGDGAALLSALEEGAVKGFRREKIEQLREHLLATGHLDTRPALQKDELVAHLLAGDGPPTSMLPATQIVRLVGHWWKAASARPLSCSDG
jgi:exonuclease SbcC